MRDYVKDSDRQRRQREQKRSLLCLHIAAGPRANRVANVLRDWTRGKKPSWIAVNHCIPLEEVVAIIAAEKKRLFAPV